MIKFVKNFVTSGNLPKENIQYFVYLKNGDIGGLTFHDDEYNIKYWIDNVEYWLEGIEISTDSMKNKIESIFNKYFVGKNPMIETISNEIIELLINNFNEVYNKQT